MALTKDVVCGMEFPVEEAEDLGAVRVEHAGETYWFCCPTCEEAFRKNPDRYARDLEATGHSH